MKHFWLMLIIACALHAMEDEAQKLSQEIMLRKSARIEYKMQYYLTHVPLPEQVNHAEFKKLAHLCSFPYAPLMMSLLERKIVKPNTDCCGQTLFMESIRTYRHEVKEEQATDLDLVRAFLNAGAKPDGVSSVKIGHDETRSYRPLKYAIHYFDLPLARVLLDAGADASCDNVLLYALDAYHALGDEKTAEHQRKKEASRALIERLLAKGADVRATCYLPHHKMVTSAYEFVQVKGLTELKMVFEEHRGEKFRSNPLNSKTIDKLYSFSYTIGAYKMPNMFISAIK